jgi:hypothetical protein
VCDSCFDLYGSKEDQSQASPSKQRHHHHHKKKAGEGQAGGEAELPAEYLASSLAQQVHIINSPPVLLLCLSTRCHCAQDLGVRQLIVVVYESLEN